MIDLLQLEGVCPCGHRADNDHLLIIANADVAVPDRCPACNNPQVYKHGKRLYQYADTPMHGKPVIVEIERQRYRCKSCGSVITPTIPSLDDKRIATRRLVEYVQGNCFNNTFTHLAKETGLVVNTIKGITLDYAEWLEKHLQRETPRLMGLDEVKIAGDYRAVITNLEMRTVFDIHENRTVAKLKFFFKNLKNKKNVEWVAADMWEPYKVLLDRYLPDAQRVIDRFHVVRMASDALEKIRIDLQKLIPKEDRIHMKKNIRWALLRGNKSRTDKDWAIVEHIRQNYPQLALAFDLKEEFFQIYESNNRTEGEQAFEKWKNSIPPEFKNTNLKHDYGEVVETVDRHHQDIFNYFDCPITNGYTEATNGVMKVANRMGRGYTYEIIRAKMLYSKIPLQAGKVVMHKANVTGIEQPVSTLGVKSEVNYGSYIPTLDELTERDEIN